MPQASQKEFRLNSGSLKPEFSQFAGFKLLELNMREPGTAEERSQERLCSRGRARLEERSQKRPGSGAGRLLLVRPKVNSLSLRHTFSFSSKK